MRPDKLSIGDIPGLVHVEQLSLINSYLLKDVKRVDDHDRWEFLVFFCVELDHIAQDQKIVDNWLRAINLAMHLPDLSSDLYAIIWPISNSVKLLPRPMVLQERIRKMHLYGLEKIFDDFTGF